jgi:pyridoxine 5'-phosphate synthase PdxJ
MKMATDPMEILNRRNAEVAKIRNFLDLTLDAKERRIAEVSEKARAEYAEAVETDKRERAERLEKSKRAVFRVPVSAHATDAEAAQIHAAFRAAYNGVYSSTLSPESPQQAEEELGRILEQAERTGDKLLARAAFHRAADLGVQSVVDAYLDTRPSENRAWESYTAAYQEVNQSRGLEHVLARGLTERALSSEAAG